MLLTFRIWLLQALTDEFKELQFTVLKLTEFLIITGRTDSHNKLDNRRNMATRVVAIAIPHSHTYLLPFHSGSGTGSGAGTD
jgi:hypothetical protein